MVNGRDLGAYTHLEPVKNAFLERHFGDASGNLYEGGRSDFREGWYELFEKKNNPEDESRSDLGAVARAAASPSEHLMEALDQVIDLDGFLTFWAMECLIGHGDGYAGNVNNYYAYHAPSTDRLHFIPWGLDQVLRPPRPQQGAEDATNSVIGVGILANRLYQSPEGREAYRNKLRWILSEVWNEESLQAQISTLARLAHAIEGDSKERGESVEALQKHVAEHRARVEPELEGPAPELRDKPLDLARRRKVGDVSFEFKTTMAIGNFRDSPAGSAEGRAELFETVFDFGKLEARSAGSFEKDSADNPVIIAIQGEPAGKGRPLAMYMLVESELYHPGATIPIDMTRVRAWAVSRGMVGMLKGRLVLDEAGDKTGAPVSGRVEGEVYSKLVSLP